MNSKFSYLAPTDIELLELLVLGMSDKDIGYRMNVVPNTTRVRLTIIKEKVNVIGNRTLLAVEYTKWKIAQQEVFSIVYEWLEEQRRLRRSNAEQRRL